MAGMTVFIGTPPAIANLYYHYVTRTAFQYGAFSCVTSVVQGINHSHIVIASSHSKSVRSRLKPFFPL